MSDLVSSLSSHLEKVERLLIGAILLCDDGEVRREIERLEPCMLRDPRKAEFIRQIKEGKSPEQAAIDLGAYVEFYQHVVDVPNPRDLPYYVAEVIKDAALINSAALTSNLAQAIANRDLQAVQQFTKRITDHTATAEPAPQSDRFNIHLSLEALLPQPQINWVAKGFIEVGSLYTICGDGGSGKTYLMYDFGITVADPEGPEYWLDFLIKHTPVLIIDEESGETRMNRRLGYIMRGHNITDNIPLYYVSLARFDIRNPGDIRALQNLIQRTEAQVVIIDALIDVIPGAEENSSKEIQPGMMALGKLAKTEKCAIILIHHTNKSGGYRGTSAIKDNVDGMYTVQKKPDSPVLEVGTEKTRDTGAVHFTAIAHFQSDTTGELESVNFSAADSKPKEAHYSKAESFVLRFLEEHKQAEISAIMAAADTCSDQSARQAVYSLTTKGRLFRIDEGGPGVKAVYALSSEKAEP
jgi:RecA-family ATPase